MQKAVFTFLEAKLKKKQPNKEQLFIWQVILNKYIFLKKMMKYLNNFYLDIFFTF